MTEHGTFLTRSNTFEVVCTWNRSREDPYGDHVWNGTCSMNRLDDVWDVTRVLVRPAQARSAGIGSMMLKRAILAVHAIDPHAVIQVIPGGYENNKEAQDRFYERNGFVKEPDGWHRYRGRRDDESLRPPLREPPVG